MIYMNSSYKQLFESNGLETLDKLWELDANVVDDPNKVRGGYCEVSLFYLDEIPFYIKKQYNYKKRSWKPPFRKRSFASKEYEAIILCKESDIRIPDCICYDESGCRAILITRGLEGMKDLSIVLSEVEALSQIKLMTRSIANYLKHLHHLQCCHGNCYPKHIFIDAEYLNVAMIDLERMTITSTKTSAMLRDLNALNRRCKHASNTMRLRFMLNYCDSDKLSESIKLIIRKIQCFKK